MEILVVGAGYAGLVTAVCFAKAGHTVYVYDKMKEKTDQLGRGEPPFFEQGMGPLLCQAIAEKRLITLASLEEGFERSGIILICVGTPPKEDGSIDLRQLHDACQQLGALMKNAASRKIFVLRSTAIPGTSAAFAERIASISGKRYPADFGVASNPEFLRQGNAIEDFMHRNLVLIGCDNESDLVALIKLYQPFGRPVKSLPLKSAEMAKYLNNCLSATKISFINEAGMLCKELGIDINDLIEALDLRVGVGNGVLKAGCGFGGSCLEKDARAIISVARERKSGLGILEKALEVNGRMPLEVVKLLSRRHMEGRNIGVLGLAFKAGTDDLRNSRSVAVINELRKINCTVAAYDPNLGADAPGLPPGIIFCDGPQVLVERSDAVLVMTEWDGFAELDYGDKVVIDTKGVVPKIKRSRNYEGICWP